MTEMIHTKVLIIGAGPAGYTAAIYTARANLSPLVVTGMQPGGQMTITTEVENYPGFADVIQGPWLMEQMQKQAEHVGAKIVLDAITDIDFKRRPFTAKGDSGAIYAADAIIVATGAQARWLGLPSEKKFQGKGVSACATCDGFFYKGKEVAIVGGGNVAVEEAIFLTNFCTKVTLIHRRDSLRAEKVMQERLFKNPKVGIVWDTVIEEVLGDDAKGMTGLLLKNVKTGKESRLAAEGLFVAIGHDPATALFKGKINMDQNGYILTAPDSTATNVAGVFAAGDVKDHVYRQAVTAAGMGCMAALEADRFLASHEAHDKNAAAE